MRRIHHGESDLYNGRLSADNVEPKIVRLSEKGSIRESSEAMLVRLLPLVHPLVRWIASPVHPQPSETWPKTKSKWQQAGAETAKADDDDGGDDETMEIMRMMIVTMS